MVANPARALDRRACLQSLHARLVRYSVSAVTQSVPVKSSHAHIRVRTQRILRHTAAAGLVGDTAIARAFGVGRSTAWRVLHHESPAPSEFIAGALASLPDATFEDLFKVVGPRETSE